MPSHYGGKDMKKKGGAKKGGAKKKRKGSMKPMTDAQHKSFNQAVKDGLITQKQHDNLPAHLLEAIVKKKKGMKKKK